MDDLYTALAAIRQPALAGTTLAAIRQPALAGCGLVAHRKLPAIELQAMDAGMAHMKLAGIDNLYRSGEFNYR